MSFSITGRTTPPMSAAVYRSGVQPGLTRYGSAPGSLLAKVADSIGSDGQMSRFFPRESPPCLASDSGCKVSGAVALDGVCTENAGLQLPFDLGGDALARNLVSDQARAGGSHLMRQHSSPAGFLSHLMIDTALLSAEGKMGKEDRTLGIDRAQKGSSGAGELMPDVGTFGIISSSIEDLCWLPCLCFPLQALLL